MLIVALSFLFGAPAAVGNTQAVSINAYVLRRAIDASQLDQFKEVDRKHWLYVEFEVLDKAGVWGWPLGKHQFGPRRPLTRYEFAVVFDRMLAGLKGRGRGLPEASKRMKDLSTELIRSLVRIRKELNSEFVQLNTKKSLKAYDQMLTDGLKASIARESKIRKGHHRQTTISVDAFKDLDKSHWAYQATDKLTKADIIWGYPKDYFVRQRILTRYEFAVALDRALMHIPSPQEPAPAGEEPHFTAENLSLLLKLVDEFRTELDGLGESVDRVSGKHGPTVAERRQQLVTLINAAPGKSLRIEPGHRAASAVERLAKLEIVKGYPVGRFHGDRAMTRYEFALAIDRMFPVCINPVQPRAADRQTQDPFKDLPKDHWAYSVCHKLAGANVIWGYPKHYFAGKRVLTRYEFAVAIDRSLAQNPNHLSSTKERRELTSREIQREAIPISDTIPTKLALEYIRLIDEFRVELQSLGVPFNKGSRYHPIPITDLKRLIRKDYERAKAKHLNSVPLHRPRPWNDTRPGLAADLYVPQTYAKLSDDPSFRETAQLIGSDKQGGWSSTKREYIQLQTSPLKPLRVLTWQPQSRSELIGVCGIGAPSTNLPQIK